jgi:hypothetical protein
VYIQSPSPVSQTQTLNQQPVDSQKTATPPKDSAKVKKSPVSITPVKKSSLFGNSSKSPCSILSGERSKGSIEAVIAEKNYGVKEIFESRLREKRSMSGKLLIHFSIDESGAVTSADIISGSMKDSVLVRKEIEYVKSWQFGAGPAKDVTKVEYLMTFKNKKQSIIFTVVIIGIIVLFFLKPYINL